ncbi:MAG: alpha/beta hydrolase-fold protein, partial [Cyclobacteriaceae bacterium]
AIIAFTRPDVFGNCGLHSGAFQVDNYATNSIVTEEVKDIKVASIWGSYEGDLSVNMRKIRDHFVNNNYDLYWKELPEGHSWGLWRATLDDMLIHFFPKK